MNKLVKNAMGKDFAMLERKVKNMAGTTLVIYGCGVNGEVFFGYLSMLGIDIAYFVDKQADIREFEVLNRKVLSPSRLIKEYSGETVIISPDNNAEIFSWLLENGIPRSNIVLPFANVEWEIVQADTYCSKNIRYETAAKQNKIEATVFSIVYNTPEVLLRRAIESVLNQTARDFTYLIIDNGSNDGSAEIIKQYCAMDSRIRLISLKENLSWTDAELLAALQDNVHGKYVCMLDSDDYYESTFLEKTTRIASDNCVDLVQVNTLTYPEDDFKYAYFTQALQDNIVLTNERLLQCFSLRILNVTFWGKLFTTEIFKKLLHKLLSFDSEDRKKKYLLDISWVAGVVENAEKVYLCDEILHVRTWRKESGEFTSANITHWLGSIVCACNSMKNKPISSICFDIFSDSALIWLFSLNRRGIALCDFDKRLLDDPGVKRILKRPLCDYLFT